jgi:ABC-2 type transport system ATP-binding protein
VAERRATGTTVLLSSHILSEVERLCDRVSIIRAGRTVESGTLGELRHLTRTQVEAEVEHDPTGLDALEGVHDLRIEDRRVRFDVDTARLDPAVRRLAELGVRSLVSQPPTLEELFLRHYGDMPGGEADDGGDGQGDGAAAPDPAPSDGAASDGGPAAAQGSRT